MTEGFEQTAAAWLLDVVPPDYRLHGVLLRHPVALAMMATHHVTACVEGARRGYRTARSELGGDLPPAGVEAVLAAYRSEHRRLSQAARSVELVARALRGRWCRCCRPGRTRCGRRSPGRTRGPDRTVPAARR